MPRQARLDIPGTLHHVIIRGIERTDIVNSDIDRHDFVSRLAAISQDTDTAIYAWALLSNHAHILLRSGPKGLPGFMRRLLTGYAISYNRRHQRHGHLFQNRYKSIVCEEDAYFRQLVRYIHLNPLRAGLVKTMTELNCYPWSGHAVVLGKIKNDWQRTKFVLLWFGSKIKEARTSYLQYMEEGISQGKRPELVGGGLIRSQGGWSEVKSQRRLGLQEKNDERILGDSAFVDQIITSADETVQSQIATGKFAQKARQLVQERCNKNNLSIAALKTGSRQRSISRIRQELAIELVETHGISQAETARQLGVSTSAIAKILARKQAGKSQ